MRDGGSNGDSNGESVKEKLSEMRVSGLELAIFTCCSSSFTLHISWLFRISVKCVLCHRVGIIGHVCKAQKRIL